MAASLSKVHSVAPRELLGQTFGWLLAQLGIAIEALPPQVNSILEFAFALQLKKYFDIREKERLNYNLRSLYMHIYNYDIVIYFSSRTSRIFELNLKLYLHAAIDSSENFVFLLNLNYSGISKTFQRGLLV